MWSLTFQGYMFIENKGLVGNECMASIDALYTYKEIASGKEEKPFMK